MKVTDFADFLDGVKCTVLLLILATGLFAFAAVWTVPGWNPMALSPIEWLDNVQSGAFAMPDGVNPITYWFVMCGLAYLSWGMPVVFIGFGLYVLLCSIPEIWVDKVRW